MHACPPAQTKAMLLLEHFGMQPGVGADATLCQTLTKMTVAEIDTAFNHLVEVLTDAVSSSGGSDAASASSVSSGTISPSVVPPPQAAASTTTSAFPTAATVGSRLKAFKAELIQNKQSAAVLSPPIVFIPSTFVTACNSPTGIAPSGVALKQLLPTPTQFAHVVLPAVGVPFTSTAAGVVSPNSLPVVESSYYATLKALCLHCLKQQMPTPTSTSSSSSTTAATTTSNNNSNKLVITVCVTGGDAALCGIVCAWEKVLTEIKEARDKLSLRVLLVSQLECKRAMSHVPCVFQRRCSYPSLYLFGCVLL